MLIMGLFVWLVMDLEPPETTNLSRVDIYQCRALAAANDGTIGLIDRGNAQLVMLDADHKVRVRIGNGGKGPGELNMPVEVCWSEPEQLFGVIDFGNARLSLWTPQGKHVADHPLPSGLLSPHLVDKQTLLTVRNAFGDSGQGAALVKLNLQDGSRQTLFETPPADPASFSQSLNDGNAVTLYFRWDPALRYAWGEGRIAIADLREPTLYWRKPNGQPLGHPVNLALPRVTVSDEQVQAGIEQLPLSLQPGAKRGLNRPDQWPSIRALHIDPQGRCWVFGAAPSPDGAYPYQVIDGNGAQVARGRVAVLPLAVTASHLIGLQPAEADLHLVRVGYR